MALGVKSVKRLKQVKMSKNALENKINALVIRQILVNFNKTNVITVTENAKTVRNPVFVPNIKNRKDANSFGFLADKVTKSIFSGDANLGTLKIAFIRNKTNKEIETVFT